MTSKINYNLRAYALIINEQDEVLISDERRNGYSFTKFPGGGLEQGEGPKDCLQRELWEELYIETEIGELFYVNDFFQQSAFRESEQLFSFYYFAKLTDGVIRTTQHEVPLREDGEQFRWVKRTQLSEAMFTFPIDKIVGDLLSSQKSNLDVSDHLRIVNKI